MSEQHRRGGKGGSPVRSDDEIIRFIVENPDCTVDYVRKSFNCSPKRASELRDKGRKIGEMQLRAKKKGEVDWREWFKHSLKTQALKRKGSFSQDKAIINIQKLYNIDKPIVIQFLSDLHMGSIATNYVACEEITDGILNTKNLFCVLNGDLMETTAMFKNSLAIHSQSMDIETQHAVLESWLNTIQPKVLTAGWCNHGVEREEKLGAFSHIKQLLNRRFIYHNGIGQFTIEHGKASYELIVSHKVAGYSIFNQLHGAKRLMRLQFPHADIMATGDKHTPDIEVYYEGEYRRAALMGGSMKIHDGYSKRYFSLYTHMEMPCVVLYPDEKWFGVYMTAAEALAVAGGLKEVPRY